MSCADDFDDSNKAARRLVVISLGIVLPQHDRIVFGLLPVVEIPLSDVTRVRIFGFSVETLSPSPHCMRTPDPLRVVGLKGLKAAQVFPERISSIRSWPLAELLLTNVALSDA